MNKTLNIFVGDIKLYSIIYIISNREHFYFSKGQTTVPYNNKITFTGIDECLPLETKTFSI